MRIRLIYIGVAEIVGSQGMGAITLADENRRRALTVVCDETMKMMLGLRKEKLATRFTLLPEVMAAMLSDTEYNDFEINIVGLNDGEYIVEAVNTYTQASYTMRLSDAVLLSLVSNFPIYIRKGLFDRQSAPFQENADRMAIPINTLATPKLREELRKAVDDENYRLAAQLKEELGRRSK